MADRLVAEIVDDHVRSLMADHLLDVASSDKHTVRPWFAGKIDFAPTVPDLKDHNIPLKGGRLDVLGGRPVVALVYQHGKHMINVFIRPATNPSIAPHTKSHGVGLHMVNYQGYNVATWSESGFDYAAVSDLNSARVTGYGGFAAVIVALSSVTACTVGALSNARFHYLSRLRFLLRRRTLMSACDLAN